MLPLWSRHRISSAASERCAGRGRRAARGSPSCARAGSGAGWRGSCGPSRSRSASARLVRELRSSAPFAAARVRADSRRSMSSTTCRTTRRATSRLASGSASRRLISVAARWTSGVTFSSTSGSSSSWCSPSRSIASCCTTRTTPEGKCARSSPSQRATFGADPLRSPPRSPYTASSAPSIPRSSPSRRTPVPSASSPPSTSRQRRAAPQPPSSLATVSRAGSRPLRVDSV